MRSERLYRFILICGLVWCFSARAWADASPKPLIEITPQLDLSHFKSNKVTLSLAGDIGASVLSMKADANAAFPGLSVTPGSPWNLNEEKGVQAVITNPGSAMVSVTLRVDNEPAAGQKNTWSAASVQIGPGETRTVQAIFGQTYGNPGFPLDPTKINSLSIYLGGDPSPVERTILIKSIDTFRIVVVQPSADIGKPPGDGLVLWLDPSKDSTVTMDASRHLSALADRSDGHHDAKPLSPEAMPSVNALDGKHRPMLHFTGKEALTVDGLRSTPGGVTVFVVYARLTGKQTPGPNPTLFSSRPDASKAVDAGPNFIIAGPDAKSPWRSIGTVALDSASIGPITFGQDYAGEIGEILVYNHTFADEGDREKVLEYLNSKWNTGIPDPSWIRDGPLDPIPNRTHDDLPLSDQANTGKWTLDPKFTDEFKEKNLDMTHWHLFCVNPAKEWPGRKPSLFLPQNVSLKDGALNIKLDKGTPDELKGHAGYDYTSGYMTTIGRTGYGYYEIEAKPAFSEFDNAFWLADTGDPDNGLEIDIFEMGPHTKEYHATDFMTAHVWGEHGDKRHWGYLVAYKTPWEIGADFHIYGLEWTKDYLIWYIDGSPVRKLKNTNWHLPQKLIFDCEPMLDWFGPIDDKDFPTAFVVKYLRVWRQADYVPPTPDPVTPNK